MAIVNRLSGADKRPVVRFIIRGVSELRLYIFLYLLQAGRQVASIKRKLILYAGSCKMNEQPGVVVGIIVNAYVAPGAKFISFTTTVACLIDGALIT